MSMKNLFFVLTFALFFTACSSKVQTNKIPNDKKYNLPLSSNYKESKMNEMERENFSLILQEFFAPREKIEEEKNLWKTGMEYFK